MSRLAAASDVKDMTGQPQSAGVMALIERMASDPSVDVAKLEKLLDLHERAVARAAKEAFHAALSSAQAEMRPVAADASNSQTRSRYASYTALDKAMRPIYTAHGFGLSFDTADAASADCVRVLCYVSHAAGHAVTYRVDMPNDGKGAKGGDVMTRTHATGAAMSYGMRYLLKMIFNVSVGEDDRDGNATPDAMRDPVGFGEWAKALDLAAQYGLTTLKQAWDESRDEFRTHMVKHYRHEHEARKARAAEVGR